MTVFNEFAERAESIVAAVGRRAELDKAYLPLMEALFKTVERMAHEHAKTPPDVIKFGEPRSLPCDVHIFMATKKSG